MASPSSNLISLPIKYTEPLPDLSTLLIEHISSTSSTTHPDSVESDAVQLSKTREKVVNVINNIDLVEGALHLTAYYAQLSYLINKLPNELITFSWYPIYSSATSAPVIGSYDNVSSALPIKSLQFERFAVLYDIAVLNSIKASTLKRNDETVMKECITGFQTAAGILNHLLELLPLIQDERVSLSPDFEPESLQCLRDLCLAQAQEVVWQNAILGRLKNGTIAKLAIQVSLYYTSALEKARLCQSNFKANRTNWSFPESVLSYLIIKSNHFIAVAQYRKSIDDLGANRYGDELGRLEIADAAVKKALSVSKRGVAEPVIRDLKSLHSIITDNLNRATKDNDLIYLAAPTPSSSLPPLTGAIMTRLVLPNELSNPLDHLVIGKLGKPLFEDLTPWQVGNAKNVWEDRREGIFRDGLGRVKEEIDGMSNRTLLELNLPTVIELSAKPTSLPSSILDQSREIRAEGGIEKLTGMMQDIRRVSKVNQKLLNESLTLLAQENQEDSHYRAKYGTDRWNRLESTRATDNFSKRAENLAGILNAAGQSDGLVRGKFGEWEARLEWIAMNEDDLQNSIPQVGASSSKGIESSQSTSIRRIRSLLDELTDLKNFRQSILSDTRRLIDSDTSYKSTIEKQADGILKKKGKILMSDFDEVFEKEEKNFKGLIEAMEGNKNKTEDVLAELKVAHASFIESRKTDPALNGREKALQQLIAAANMYFEILNNLKEGLGFYADLAKLLTELRDGVKEFAYNRAQEAIAFEQELNRQQLEAVNLNPEETATEVEEPPRRSSPRKKAAAAAEDRPSGDTGKDWNPSMGIRFG